MARGSESSQSRDQARYSVVGGTVFREPGFALPGAEVRISPDPANASLKPIKIRTDARGEFAVRVPAQKQRYRVEATAKGYERQEKMVEVLDGVRAEVTLTLAASSNK